MLNMFKDFCQPSCSLTELGRTANNIVGTANGIAVL